jgi:hypothetical protein
MAKNNLKIRLLLALLELVLYFSFRTAIEGQVIHQHFDHITPSPSTSIANATRNRSKKVSLVHTCKKHQTISIIFLSKDLGHIFLE